MTTGSMQFGQSNDAELDKTVLTSTARAGTLHVQNGPFQSETAAGSGIVANGRTGVFGFSWTHGVESGHSGIRGVSRGRGGIAVAGIAYGEPDAETEDWHWRRRAVGVLGMAGHENALAGWFSGSVVVWGDLVVAGTKAFRIDHPLDPENRYLQHACVESPDQLNVYSGTVVTDHEASAVVELPEYFQALNKDFRYQLTVIGGFAQAVISKEVQDNRFVIATDRPEAKVSWQVTGVRQDPYVRANPFTVEEEKPEDERGTYLHPEPWGKPKETGTAYERLAAFMKTSGVDGGTDASPM
ncbi:hypothetical protein PV721_06200 [Streptomyces sp. MB09-01]|uniref:hypothetical protein n=1 Tax=Streptomyces sp. MB09-01 TaxID=3028666 RepID=UPI0029BEBD5C|nr:hypothetical protein [Streptomyces sp. MB09-01]MDX3533965.1 hypothetical protein [Streptomyces sp. MB09-01]